MPPLAAHLRALTISYSQATSPALSDDSDSDSAWRATHLKPADSQALLALLAALGGCGRGASAVGCSRCTLPCWPPLTPRLPLQEAGRDSCYSAAAARPLLA